MTRALLALEPLAVRGGHSDLQLQLGSFRHACDSYYLLLDDSLMAGTSLCGALARFLGQWLKHVRNLADAGECLALLPFDFSDQCSAWLRIFTPNGSDATVTCGWSSIEGYSFMPSDFDATARALTDLAPIPGAHLQCTLTDLITAITINRDNLATTDDCFRHW